jgi:mannosyl-3-phosphoglycerate synthase
MRIEIPHETESFGAVRIHSVQKVFELDAGLRLQANETHESDVIRRLSYERLHNIEEVMAVVIPIRGERIKLIQGVLTGIPNHCLIIAVSNSPRQPVDRFAMERDAILGYCQLTNKQAIVVHQKDAAIADAFRQMGGRISQDILSGRDGLVRSGKAEGMVVATLLAWLMGRRYIGFVDADNYFPGAVLEYIHEYAAGFAMSQSKYAMTRIAWHSKPKIVEETLFFAKWGRTSRNTNRLLNMLLTEYTGFETEIIKTGNAGEHALTMDLALTLRYSSGYSVEPYHYINLFEQFGGIEGTSLSKELILERVDVFQVESRNPHMHDTEKGEAHIDEMTYAASQVIHDSPICPAKLKKTLRREMRAMNERLERKPPGPIRYYGPLGELDIAAFAKALGQRPYSSLFAERLAARTDRPPLPAQRIASRPINGHPAGSVEPAIEGPVAQEPAVSGRAHE